MKRNIKIYSVLPMLLVSALCFVSCKPDNQEENNKSEGNPPIEEYTPTMGLSDCLKNVLDAKSAGKESFCYEITENGLLLVEHRLMVLNCGNTVVATSLEQHGDLLTLREEECLGKDSMMMTCYCLKNVGYEAGAISTDTDSLLIQYRFFTFERGLRTRSFKIPAQGKGLIVL